MNPRAIEAALDALRPGWRERKLRRKSKWNLVCVFLGFGLAGAYWYALFRGAWLVHVSFFPEHQSMLSRFWRAGISGGAFVSSFFLLMPLAIPAFTLGFLSANCIVWTIPPARRSMDAEAAGDREMTFAGSNVSLIKWGGLASGVGLVLSFIGIVTLRSLR